jgi:hypothetical protein
MRCTSGGVDLSALPEQACVLPSKRRRSREVLSHLWLCS